MKNFNLVCRIPAQIFIDTTFKKRSQGHAEELARDHDFSEYDAIITISGDGLIFEVINGLMNRKDNLKIPLAALPAGSGNALVTSLVHGYQGKGHDFYLLKNTFAYKNKKAEFEKIIFIPKTHNSLAGINILTLFSFSWLF